MTAILLKPHAMTDRGGSSLSRMRSRRKLVNRRRTSPWLLVLALTLFLVSIGLILVVGFMLGSRITTVEESLGLREE